MSAFPVKVRSWHEIDPVVAYRILQLRVEVFVVEQECAYAELDGLDLAPTTRHFWVEVDDAVAGYLRLLNDDDDGVARIGRVCVARASRSGGLAGVLMQAALAHLGDRPSVLDAQTYVQRWYERLGYRVTGPDFLDDGIPHVPMRRDPTG